jgi:DNA-binding transcriptional LysR family regulator
MIDKLEFLIALARERNFSRAAESCGVTQPTLSAGIKQLEDTLGVLLVNRSSRFYGLTAEGERVLEWGRRIVSDARAMRQDVHTAKTSLTGHLTLAAVPTALSIAAELTIPFRAKYPSVRFTVLSKTSREILSMLGDFQIDAGLTYLDNEPLGELQTVPLLTRALPAFDLRRKPAGRA